MVSAISDRLSRLKPASYITPKVPISDSGSATPAMTVARSDAQEQEAPPAPPARRLSTSVNCTSRTEARMVSVRSVTTVELDAGRQRALQLRQFVR